MTVYITMPELAGVNIAGSGRVESKDLFTTSEFDANVSGSGGMNIRVEAEETNINISGSGNVNLGGKSDLADISVSGSGNINALDFIIGEAEVKIMGSGNCNIHVTNKLRSKIMGSGNVSYKGSPQHVNNESMGSGKVRNIN